MDAAHGDPHRMRRQGNRSYAGDFDLRMGDDPVATVHAHGDQEASSCGSRYASRCLYTASLVPQDFIDGGLSSIFHGCAFRS